MERVPHGCVVGGLTQVFTAPCHLGLVDRRRPPSEFQDETPVFIAPFVEPGIYLSSALFSLKSRALLRLSEIRHNLDRTTLLLGPGRVRKNPQVEASLVIKHVLIRAGTWAGFRGTLWNPLSTRWPSGRNGKAKKLSKTRCDA